MPNKYNKINHVDDNYLTPIEFNNEKSAHRSVIAIAKVLYFIPAIQIKWVINTRIVRNNDKIRCVLYVSLVICNLRVQCTQIFLIHVYHTTKVLPGCYLLTIKCRTAKVLKRVTYYYYYLLHFLICFRSKHVSNKYLSYHV